MIQRQRPPLIVWGVLACIVAAILAALASFWRECVALGFLAWLAFRK